VQSACLSQEPQQMQYKPVPKWLQTLSLSQQTHFTVTFTLLPLLSLLFCERTVVCTLCPDSLLNQLSCCRYLGPDYGNLQRPAGEVALADLPRLAHESFPLCMLVSHTARQVKLHLLSACKANSTTQTSSMCCSFYDFM